MKPCPFCGSDNLELIPVGRFFAVYCSDCTAQGPTCRPEGLAKTLWNRRDK